MFTFPREFVQFMSEIHGEREAREWLGTLPGRLEECAECWNLMSILPTPFKLSYHYITAAQRADGRQVILKAFSPTGEFSRAREALRVLRGPGMVRLLAEHEEYEIMLLERLLPGATLAGLFPDRDELATTILAATMRSIWRPVPEKHAFPSVEDWGAGLTRLRAYYQGSYGPFPARLVDQASMLFRELSASAGESMLLHGDLHHENILSTEQGWCAIDPKGVVGDPGYEVGASFYNPNPIIFQRSDLKKILARRVDQLAAELGMEWERVRGWGLAQSVLSAWWSVEDSPGTQPPAEVLACAEILASLKK